MDFLKDNVHSIYRSYLVPTLGAALAMSIYSFVDTIAVGQYAGAVGTAAIAVINPLYTLMYVLASLFALGGSVHMGNALGRGKKEEGLQYFTIATIGCALVTVASWLLCLWKLKDILVALGANEEIFSTAYAYGRIVIGFLPIIVGPDFFAAFLRLDRDPKRAFRAVLTGGVINIFLDWFLVFPMNMGVAGAATATVIGTAVQDVIMLSHFVSKKNTLRFVNVSHPFRYFHSVFRTGISSLLIDLGTIGMNIVMNQTMLIYGGTEALGVYGVLNTIALLAQAVFAGVGQTVQLGASVNHGAGKTERVRSFFHLGLRTAMVIGICIFAFGEILPRQILYLFMGSDANASLGPYIMRRYMPMFVMLGFNILAAYLLQGILQQRACAASALLRSLIMPLVTLFVLSRCFGAEGVYCTLGLSEWLSALLIYIYLRRETRLFEDGRFF